MKHIRTFNNLFESHSGLSPEQISLLNFFDKEESGFRAKYGVEGTWKLNPSTGLVDVEGNIYFDGGNLYVIQDSSIKKYLNDNKGKIPVRFGKISGDFVVRQSDLVSLEGSPLEVGGSFDCSHNQLTSLEGAPQKVGVNFDCSSNQLTSLKGATQEVKGNFDCFYSELKSLNGAPRKVGGRFNCMGNHLSSLEGSPLEVGDGVFNCNNMSSLKSLLGAPVKIIGIRGTHQAQNGNLHDVYTQFKCDDFTFCFLEEEKSHIYTDGAHTIYSEKDWGLEGWLDVLKKGNEKARSLILPILPPSSINKEIQKDPEVMMVKLKGVWNDPMFADTKKKIFIPSRYKADMDTLGDLNDLGF